MTPPDYLASLGKSYERRSYSNGYHPRGVLPIVCVNGLQFSVRKTDKEAGTAELIKINRSLVALEPYRRRPENDHHTSDTYYSGVPVELVNRIIMRNGGLATRERINEIVLNSKLILLP